MGDESAAAENVVRDVHHHYYRRFALPGEASQGYEAMNSETFLSGNTLNVLMVLLPLICMGCFLYATCSIMCCCISTLSLFKEKIVGYGAVDTVGIKYDELSHDRADVDVV